MKSLPRVAWPGVLAAALAGAAFVAATVQAAPLGAVPRPGAAPRAMKPLPPAEGEVIVRFKADAPMLVQHPLAARAKPEAVSDALARRAQALGARVGRPLEAGAAVGEGIQVIRQRGADAAELARRLAADPAVAFAEPNGRQRRLQVPPNDPLYPFASRAPNGPDAGQWYLRRPDTTFRSSIDIETAWARGFGNPGVVVAVLDTGVRFDHPDLGTVANGGKLLPGRDFVGDAVVANDAQTEGITVARNGQSVAVDWDADASDPGDWIDAADKANNLFSDCDVSPSSWHGTATSSLVAAAANNGGIGMAGTAPGVRILPVRALGKCFGRDSDIQAAMRWAAGIAVAGVPLNPTPAKVLNMSLGSDAACSASYQAAVDEIVARGVVIVAAAGNSAGEPVGTPASCNGVVAVAALRHVGTKVGFSDLGPQIAVAAPGGNCVNIVEGEPCLYPILAALNSGFTTPQASIWSDSFDITVGTSFASPLVAGTAALLFSQNPSLTVGQVRALLQGTARAFPTTGGSTTARACVAPAAGAEQLECYCPNEGSAGYPLCGAGMLDAGAAVNAAATGLAAIDLPAGPAVRGNIVTLSAANSVAAPGRSIAAWSWELVDGGGSVGGFTGSSSSATTALAPIRAANIVVRLTVTDDAGASATTTKTIVVTDTPQVPVLEGSSGGGAWSWPWLLGLAAAVVVLAPTRQRARPRTRPRTRPRAA